MRYAGWLGVALAVGGWSAAQAPNPAPDPPPAVMPNYELASRYMPQAMDQLVFDTSVTPHWFHHSDKFWYSYKTTAGTGYWLADPVARTRVALWDNARLAARLSELTNLPYDAQHLGIENLELLGDDSGIRFSLSVRKDARMPGETAKPAVPGSEAASQEMRDVYFEYALGTGEVRRLDGYAPPEYPLWASLSPDRQTVLFARGDNLYLMDAANYAKAVKDPADATIQEVQLTTDGVAKYSYARPLVPEEAAALKKQDKKDADNPKGMRRPAIGVHWSQDGKKFALVRQDERKVAELWVIHSLAEPRPELESYSYAMPGDSNVPIPEIQIFTLASRQRVVIPARDLPLVDPSIAIADAPENSTEREHMALLAQLRTKLGLQGVGGPSGSPRWVAAGSDKLYFTSTARDFRDIDLCVADAASGAVKTLIQESSNVWIDARPNPYGGQPLNVWLANHGQDLVWWSERDGWAHYYLYDASGKLLNPITTGSYMSDQIVGMDESSGTLYFLAEGRDPKLNPYYQHLYKVGLNGTGLTDLTPGDANDIIAASDDTRYFVSTASRVDTVPESSLEDGAGARLAHLATADVSRLLAAGFQYPEPFKVKAADGITDIYGVMYKPSNFDPKRSYPVIEHVYPGPQTEEVPASFTPKDPEIPLAQLGFVVLEVGGRGGSPQRDKWYDSFGYGNLRDYGLADKRQVVLELAQRDPWIDVHRVGIWGHSGGGFMSAAAMLQYPGFFKAGWSESGNHDNNVYNKTWSEKYDGVRSQEEKNGETGFLYTIEKNSDLAANLQGHLMLTTGDMDNNVSMVNTMRLANALIHADKRFDMLVFPGMRHPYTPINDYVLVRRMDFFARWLLGAADISPDIVLLQNEKQHTPSKKFIE